MELTIADLPNGETSNTNFSNIKSSTIKPILKLKTNNIETNNINKKTNTKRVSYDDILAKMGMYVDNGKLHLADKGSKEQCVKPTMQCSKVKCNRIQESLKQNSMQNQQSLQQQSLQQQSLQNSYIYNKHFKNHLYNNEPKILVPTTPEEYNQMMLKKILENKIQRLRINRMKSTKLIMPTENIHIAQEPSSNLNRFFQFSQR